MAYTGRAFGLFMLDEIVVAVVPPPTIQRDLRMFQVLSNWVIAREK